MENFSFTKLAEELDSVVSGVSFEGKTQKWGTKDEVQSVIDEINKCEKLLFLNLEGNSLGVEAAKAIGEVLKKHPEFQKALWKDLFTGRLKTEIPLALKEMGLGIAQAGAHLTVLDCSDNALGPNGMVGLVDLIKSPACYSLKELKLNNCGLGIQGGKMLASALLSCHESSVQAGTPLELKIFIAGRNRLENDGAKALSKVFATIKTLEEIAIPQNGIYHIGITALSGAFKENQNMRILNLNDNTITAKGALSLSSALTCMQRLKEINFGDCLLKSEGAILIAEALQEEHEDLETIILDSNEIGLSGGVTIASAIANKNKLKSLMLDSNQFGEEGCITIKEIMERNEKTDCLETLENDEGEEEDDEGEDEDEQIEDEEDEEDDQRNENEEENERGETIIDDKTEECDKSVSIETISNKGDSSFYGEDDCDVNYIAEFQNRSLDKVTQDTSNKDNDNSVVFLKEEELPNTIEAFVDSPNISLKIFNALEETNKLESFRSYLKQFESDDLLVRLTFLVLKCSDISEESAEALEIAIALYKDVFDYAKETNQISRVRTFFLTQLGLLKCEDKSFRPAYNLNACRTAAKIAIDQKCFPDEIGASFKLFLEKFTDIYDSK